jgi:BirA family transcriptional regulator, biotin operon repressor / biotin---[acetyl-CoA-carboxylase] ligase
MAGAILFRDALPGDDTGAGLELDHLVEEEERRSMRKDLFDLRTPERGGHLRVLRLHGDTLRVSGTLSPDEVLPRLRGRFGRPYAYVERCESTQRLLDEDAPEGAVAATDEQTDGRGRLGRSWVAPAGSSVLVSIALRPAVPTPRLPELSFVAGKACAAAIAEVAAVDVAVKHPNDVLVRGRKIAGVLAEARDGRVVLGVGINVSQRTEDLPDRPDLPATSLLLETDREHDRAELLVALLEHLEREYDAWVAAYT